MRAAILGLTLGLLGCNQILGVDDVQIGTGDGDAAIDADPNAIDADPNAPDAEPIPIDATPGPDAIPVGGALGQACDEAMTCPSEAPLCIAINQGDPQNFCTLGCGSSPSQDMPPPGGDDICAAQYQGGGQAMCILIGGQTGSDWDFYCAIVCPNGQSDCPDQLTCNQQVCGASPP